MKTRILVVSLLAGALAGRAGAQTSPPLDQPAGVADGLAASLSAPLADLVAEVLDRNPDLARARREAVAAELRAPQASSLPDPMATLTPFLSSPETRVGPQQLAFGISQRLPWFGKLALRDQAALYGAAAAHADAEARAVALVTETRRLYYDLAFLAAQEAAVRADLATLEHYEELARARYASGIGLEQAVVKIQAEITKDQSRLLGIGTRQASLVASLDALRDREPGAALPQLVLPENLTVPEFHFERLDHAAMGSRPEVARARARIAEAETLVELARKESRPDLTLGLSYTVVGEREDAAGRAMPPEGNGDDVIGLTAAINLPVWRRRIEAAVEEAAQRELAAQEGLRAAAAEIDKTLGELLHRIPLTAEQHELLAGVLTVQAEEALRSAEAAYGAGTLGALDLLDAERLLLEVRVAAARSLADLAIAVARLEGAIAQPLAAVAPADPGNDDESAAAGSPAEIDHRSSESNGAKP